MFKYILKYSHIPVFVLLNLNVSYAMQVYV